MTHVTRAEQFLRQQQPDEALAEVQTAIQMAPGSADIQASLCEALVQMNRIPEAQSACQTALTIAQRVYPEFQFQLLPRIRAISAMSGGAGVR